MAILPCVDRLSLITTIYQLDKERMAVAISTTVCSINSVTIIQCQIVTPVILPVTQPTTNDISTHTDTQTDTHTDTQTDKEKKTDMKAKLGRWNFSLIFHFFANVRD